MPDFTTVSGDRAWSDVDKQYTSARVRANDAERPDAEVRLQDRHIQIRTGARVKRARGPWVGFKRAMTGLRSVLPRFLGGLTKTDMDTRNLRHAEYRFDKNVNKLVEDLANKPGTLSVKELCERLNTIHKEASTIKNLSAEVDGTAVTDDKLQERFAKNLQESLAAVKHKDPAAYAAISKQLGNANIAKNLKYAYKAQLDPDMQRLEKTDPFERPVAKQDRNQDGYHQLAMEADLDTQQEAQAAFGGKLIDSLKEAPDALARSEASDESELPNLFGLKPETDKPLGHWFERLPGAPSLDNLQTNYTDKYAEGESHISTFITADGQHHLIGKIERSVAEGHLQAELNAYKDIYQKAGPHPNLGKVYGMAVVKYGQRKESAMIMEEVPGQRGSKTMDLLHKAWKENKISSAEYWGTVQFIGRRLFDVTEHLAKAGIVHNDIKPENYVVDKNTGEPIVIDLGLHSKTNQPAQGFTEEFQPPEIKRGAKTATEKSDVFSTGATLLHGTENLKRGKDQDRMPKDGLDIVDKAYTLDNKGNPQHKPGYAGVETAYTRFMDSVMAEHPDDRPDSVGAKGMDFLSDSMIDDDQAKAVLKNILDPNQNPELQNHATLLLAGSTSKARRPVELSYDKLEKTGRGLFKLQRDKASLQLFRPGACLKELGKSDALVDQAYQQGQYAYSANQLKDKALRFYQKLSENAQHLYDYQHPTLASASTYLQQEFNPRTQTFQPARLSLPTKRDMYEVYEQSNQLVADAQQLIEQGPSYNDLAKLELMEARAQAMIDLQKLGKPDDPKANHQRLAQLKAQLHDIRTEIETLAPQARSEAQVLVNDMSPWFTQADTALKAFQESNPVVKSRWAPDAKEHALKVADAAQKALDDTRVIRDQMKEFALRAQAFLSGTGKKALPEQELETIRQGLNTANTLLKLEQEWITPTR